tara:strand:- start:281 stop:844 length:564 start_codon:yes stop_codon:yes gene_type:complete
LSYTKAICGIDEVGRGALAGPVVVASVIFDNYKNIPNFIQDSKKINMSKRVILFEKIKNVSKIGIGIVSVNTIDAIGISRATNLAAIKSFRLAKLKVNKIITDGNIKFRTKIKLNSFHKGDNNYVSIAAASIIAKVTRDNIMIKLCKKNNRYNWKKNMGYGTKEHLLAIKKYGITELHRKSFKINNE